MKTSTQSVALDPNCPAASIGAEKTLAKPEEAALLFGDYEGRLGLRLNDGGKSSPLTIDFASGPNADRALRAFPKRETLARACGVTRKHPIALLDASAGLGRDSLVLAACGAKVTMVERNPFLAAMLQEAVDGERASEEWELSFAKRDVLDFSLEELQAFDTIYFDPMFPERKKAAAVKLDMQVLQALHGGEEDDAEEVLAHLIAAKVHRVVVKRPVKADELSALERPNLRMRSGAMRFDVWLDF